MGNITSTLLFLRKIGWDQTALHGVISYVLFVQPVDKYLARLLNHVLGYLGFYLLLVYQRQIFIFGVLLEGLRRVMSYKLVLHLLVTFTEQVVLIHKHITEGLLHSEFHRYQEQKQSQ